MTIWPVQKLKSWMWRINGNWTHTLALNCLSLYLVQKNFIYKVKGLFILVTATIKTCSIYSVPFKPNQSRVLVEMESELLYSRMGRISHPSHTSSLLMKSSKTPIHQSISPRLHKNTLVKRDLSQEDFTLRPPPRGVRCWLRGYCTMVLYTLYTLMVCTQAGLPWVQILYQTEAISQCCEMAPSNSGIKGRCLSPDLQCSRSTQEEKTSRRTALQRKWPLGQATAPYLQINLESPSG